jgi:hypothetical protein
MIFESAIPRIEAKIERLAGYFQPRYAREKKKAN